MPLDSLSCEGSRITNYYPLNNVPLKVLSCDFVPERDAATLRSIKTLEKINGLPLAEFWKQVEAGATPRPWTNMGKQQEQ